MIIVVESTCWHVFDNITHCFSRILTKLPQKNDSVSITFQSNIREFTKPRRRRRGQRRLKNRLYFTYESRDTRKSFTLFITVKTIWKLNAKHCDKYEIEILKFSRRGSRSPDNAEFGHFALLFCRRRQINVPRIITHVHSYCFAH